MRCYPCILLWACLALTGHALHAQGGAGYWSLVTSKTLVDGTKSQGDNTGWSSYKSNSFEGYIQRIKKGESGSSADRFSVEFEGKTYSYDGTQATKDRLKSDPKYYQAYYYASLNPDKVTWHGGGGGTRDTKEIHKLSVTWSSPPQYVKVGEENKITVTFKGMWDGAPFNYDKHSEVVNPRTVAAANEGFNVGLLVQPMCALDFEGVKVNFDRYKQGLMRCNSIAEAERISSEEFFTEADEARLDAVRKKAAAEGRNLEEELDKVYWTPEDWDTVMRLSGESRLAYSGGPWGHERAFPKGSFMLVRATFEYSTIAISPVAGIRPDRKTIFSVSQYFLYQFTPEGGDVEVIVDAKDKSGEDDGTLLPPWIVPGSDSDGGLPGIPAWVIPVGVGVAVGGLVGSAIRRRRKKSKDAGDDPGDDGREEEQKEPSSYKMILYKEFGNTLVVNDPPKTVGARIEEITAKGQHIARPDLTARITVAEGDNIKVLATGMTEKYRCAKIQVQELPKTGPMEGSVLFTFRDLGGALTTRMVFQLADGKVEFFQENLTMPARYDEEFRLPFVVHGVSEEATVEASIGRAYDVKVEKDKKTGAWYAVIKELDKKEGRAGEYTNYTLTVTATDPNGHQVEGTLPVMRMHMGLMFRTEGYLGCFPERYDPMKHPMELKSVQEGVAYAPSLNDARYTFLYWNKKSNRLVHILPEHQKIKLTAMPLEGAGAEDEKNRYFSRETKGMSDEDFAKKIKPQRLDYSITEDNTMCSYIYANALLDAPSRRKIRLCLSYEFTDPETPGAEPVEYKAEQVVWATSQPLRDCSPDELYELEKKDKEVTRVLYRIQDFIINHDLLNRIGPIYRTVEMLLDGYDVRFGYDPVLVNRVRQSYLDFVSGRTLGANATPEGVESLGLAAELVHALAMTSDQAEAWLDEHAGFFGRMAISICTLGWADAALTGLKVCREMEDVVTREKNPGGCWEAFFVGVKVVAVEALQDAVSDYVMGGVMERVGKSHPEFFDSLESMAAKTKEKLGVFGMDVKDVYADMKNYASERWGKRTLNQFDNARLLNSNAGRSADDVIMDFRRNSKWSAEEAMEDQMFRNANMDGLRKVKEFERAYHDYRYYRTPEAEMNFKRMCYEIQTDKIAQKQLALYKSDYAGNVRSEYYRTLSNDYTHIDRDARRYVAQELQAKGYNVHEEDISIFCATNSNKTKLMDGDAITRDRDVTILVKRKPTKDMPNPIPEEISQDIAEKAYARAYTERTGLTMSKGDQCVVQPGSLERIGAGADDLNRGFKKEFFGEAYQDVKGVANAFEHKPAEWIEAGLADAKMGLFAQALAKQEEGLRQAVKLFNNSLYPRATFRGTLSKLSPKQIEMFKVISKLEVVSQGATSLSLPEVKKILRDVYKVEITDVPGILKSMLLAVES